MKKRFNFKKCFKMNKKVLIASICIITTLTSITVGVVMNNNNSAYIFTKTKTGADGLERKATSETGNCAIASEPSKAYNDSYCTEQFIAAPNDSTNCISSIAPVEYDLPTSKFSDFSESEFIYTKTNPISTFSSDIDTASYVSLRQYAANGRDLTGIRTSGMLLRTEEVLNYFEYDYKDPASGQVFGITNETSICPWNKNNSLVHIGIKAKDVDVTKKAPLNLVFLIDVSGSMSDENKLPLLQKSLTKLVKQLDKNDTISIVTYASDTKVVLNKAKGSQKKVITYAINTLTSGGGTNGGNGLSMAYKLAKQNFNKKYNNRIILATDGDFNFGMTSTDELKTYISKQRKAGIYLSVLGFGSSYNDAIMETLADNGNGNYNIIDKEAEAERVLQSEFLGTMYTVANDVKFQVTFDPKSVSQYRLIGYENRALETKDFDDDTKDAGDMGAGQTVTIVYEVAGTNDTVSSTKSSPIKLDIRYKDTVSSKSKKLSYNIDTTIKDSISDDMQFIAAAIETVMLLNNSKYLDANKRSLSEIQHDLKYINLNASQKDFYNTVSMLVANTTKTSDIDYKIEPQCNTYTDSSTTVYNSPQYNGLE